MKKTLAAALCVLALLALAACGGAENPTNPSGSALNFYFAPKGVQLVMGADPTAVLPALEEPLNTFPSPSCAVSAVDTNYSYPGYVLTVTEPDKGEDYITAIKLADDTYATAEGVYIGSSFDEVTAAYGTAYEEVNGFYTYTRGRSTLQFKITDGAVTQIVYDYLF
jgi:hypothetical protein